MTYQIILSCKSKIDNLSNPLHQCQGWFYNFVMYNELNYVIPEGQASSYMLEILDFPYIKHEESEKRTGFLCIALWECNKRK